MTISCPTIDHPRCPPHMMRVFSRFSPKKVPLEDTTDSVVVLAVGDDRRRGGEVGLGDGGWRGVGGVVSRVACCPVGGGGGDHR